MRTGVFDAEFRIVRQTMRFRWVWSSGFQVRDSAGGIRRIVGVTQDITDTEICPKNRGERIRCGIRMGRS